MISFIRRYLFAFFLCWCSILLAQPNTDWSIAFGSADAEFSKDVVSFPNNTFAFLSTRYTSESTTEICLTKVEFDGTQIWSKCFPSQGFTQATSMLSQNDSSYLITGYSHASDFLSDAHYGAADAFLLKLNANGEEQWRKTFGGSRQDIINDILLDASGNILMTGTTLSNDGAIPFNNGLTDVWILKVNPNGQLIWSKTIGGASHDKAYKILGAESNRFLILGHSASGNEYRNGSDDYYAVKIDADGNEIWNKTYGGDGTDQAFDGLSLPNGEFVMIGKTNTFGGDVGGIAGGYDGWVIRANQNGDLLWSKTIGGMENESLTAITKTLEGQLLVVGHTNSDNGMFQNSQGSRDAFISAFELDGQPLWTKNYGGSQNDSFESMVESGDGSILLSGYSRSSDGDLITNKGASDSWLLKLEGTSQLVVNLGADKSICAGEEVRLSPNVVNCDNCTYLWSDDNIDAERVVAPATDQTYSLTVTNANGAFAVDEIVITVNELPEVMMQLSQVSCYGKKDGEIGVVNPDETHSYSWSNGNSQSFIQNLDKGNYTLTITSSAGCTSVKNFEIKSPDSLTVLDNIVLPKCFDSQDGEIELTVSGGSENYNFLWNTDAQTAKVTSLESGNYQVTIDDGQCDPIIKSFEIIAPTSITIDTALNYPTSGNRDGKIVAIPNGGTAPYQFNWSTGAVDKDSLKNLSAGDYQLTITDANGCQMMFEFTLEETTSSLSIQSLSQFEISPNPNNGIFNTTIQFDDYQEFSLKLVDVLGRLYYQSFHFEQSLNKSFTNAHLSAGLYFLRIETLEGMAVRKVLIQN